MLGGGGSGRLDNEGFRKKKVARFGKTRDRGIFPEPIVGGVRSPSVVHGPKRETRQ